ncbi:hypothetical protein XENTR_v10011132 [Xenopus tropicalis]|nr:hypothetical protein XENTR_v10011132 [Xenopus tropicalis]
MCSSEISKFVFKRSYMGKAKPFYFLGETFEIRTSNKKAHFLVLKLIFSFYVVMGCCMHYDLVKLDFNCHRANVLRS